MHSIWEENSNLLLTGREGRTEEYWPKVVAVWTEHREVRAKMTEGQYSPVVGIEQGRLLSSSLYGAPAMLARLSKTKIHSSCMTKSRPRKNQSECSDLPHDYLLAIIMIMIIFSIFTRCKKTLKVFSISALRAKTKLTSREPTKCLPKHFDICRTCLP